MKIYQRSLKTGGSPENVNYFANIFAFVKEGAFLQKYIDAPNKYWK